MSPRSLYLPVLLRERCSPELQRVDVALVLDASTSMLADDGSGRTKLAAARVAVRVFLDALGFDSGDQAAVIAFNEDATMPQPLTGRRPDLDAALMRLEVRTQTRIDLGIEAATLELLSDRANPANAPVMIVLTDGRANPVGPEVAVARAQEAKARGIAIFTIGLGDDLDREALGLMSSGADRFYHSPGPADLEAIYRRIAVLLPCPGEVTGPTEAGSLALSGFVDGCAKHRDLVSFGSRPRACPKMT